jgi:hypothetical protein
MIPTDPAVVRQQIEALKRECPEIFEGDDERLFADMLEGSTDAVAFLEAIEERVAQDQAYISALKNREGEIRARRERIEERIEARRKLEAQVLRATGRGKIETASATFYFAKGRTRVVVDQGAVPPEFRRLGPPDLTKIREHLDRGNKVNWGALSQGDETLSVRRS